MATHAPVDYEAERDENQKIEDDAQNDADKASNCEYEVDPESASNGSSGHVNRHAVLEDHHFLCFLAAAFILSKHGHTVQRVVVPKAAYFVKFIVQLIRVLFLADSVLKVIEPLTFVNSCLAAQCLVEFASSVPQATVPVAVVPGAVHICHLTSTMTTAVFILLTFISGLAILQVHGRYRHPRPSKDRQLLDVQINWVNHSTLGRLYDLLLIVHISVLRDF